MKAIVPPPAGIVHNDFASIQALFQRHVVPTYARFDLAFSRGMGSYVWDLSGRRYLDLGAGIAVTCVGHAHPEVTEALVEQSKRLVHVSNLYYHEGQGQLAAGLTERIGPGKVFFGNSGAEANEGLFKLARAVGHDEGRFEILTTWNSFHGRTLAGIAATGQEKVKKGFDPATPGFRHVPFNDLAALKEALSPSTIAVLIEGIQGEGGIIPARPDYLLGLRRLCNEHRLLLLMDCVQCGHFRTGRFQSFQRVLEDTPAGSDFLPDGISMAKSLGGGFPISAFWVRQPYADRLGPGSHGTTYGGNPLGCAVSNRILEIIARDRLEENARRIGDILRSGLQSLSEDYPQVLRQVRGLGLMLGVELAPDIPAFAARERSPAVQMVDRLHHAGLLTIPSGQRVVRLLPPLTLSQTEAEAGLESFRSTVSSLAS